MRVLQACKKFPFPVRDGEGVAVRALALGLLEAGHTVDLVSLNTSKHRVEDLSTVDLPHYDLIESCDLDNDVSPLRAALSLLSPGSYHASRFESPSFAELLRQILERATYDVVILETVILAMYAPVVRAHAPQALVVLRTHNIEHEIWARIGSRSPWYVRPAYGVFARRLRRFERAWINAPDLILPITGRDSRQLVDDLGCRRPRHVVPVGYDIAAHGCTSRAPLSSLVPGISFIGSLDWAPNLEGLDWFLAEVWPLLSGAFPNLVFHIAGRKMPERIRLLVLPNVIVHGEVEDSAAYLQRYPLTVAPILSGSGTRVKILDAMVCGRVVLTTEMGLEGIAARDREEVLICRTPTAFVDQVRYVLADPAVLERIGQQAHDLIRREFDFARIGYSLSARLRDLRNSLGLAAGSDDRRRTVSRAKRS